MLVSNKKNMLHESLRESIHPSKENITKRTKKGSIMHSRPSSSHRHSSASNTPFLSFGKSDRKDKRNKSFLHKMEESLREN